MITNITKQFPAGQLATIKAKVLNWCRQFNTFCFLDNHQYQIPPHTQECLVAAGSRRSFTGIGMPALDRFQAFVDEQPAWLFGHFNYELQTGEGAPPSRHPHRVSFPDIYFFEPEILLRINDSRLQVEGPYADEIANAILSAPASYLVAEMPSPRVQQHMNRDEYLSVIRRLQEHILRGDCYEINFCQEFFATSAVIDPVDIYRRLAAISPNPFSALYRVNDRWLVCASPERFLSRKDNHLVSQPMKGTARREAGHDLSARQALYKSEKDRSENVMVVDLVRNDLSRVCREGSVKVDELYGVYDFPQVFQMISTVSGDLQPGTRFSDILRCTFPMGSMTGAPKKRVMELINRYETSGRGLFSGSLGYMAPGGDFDFNVVIRSLFYDAAGRQLSFQAGSGITYYSDPEKEWDECLLKAGAIRAVLENRD